MRSFGIVAIKELMDLRMNASEHANCKPRYRCVDAALIDSIAD